MDDFTTLFSKARLSMDDFTTLFSKARLSMDDNSVLEGAAFHG